LRQLVVNKMSLVRSDTRIYPSPQYGQKGEDIEYLLLPMIVVATGTGLFCLILCYTELRDPPWPLFIFGTLAGCGCLFYGGYMIAQRFLNRTQESRNFLQAATKHRLESAFRGRIINGDETRISRRTEGRGEFRAAGVGCLSGSQSGEPEETELQVGTTRLERYVLHRPDSASGPQIQ
jgi:hypothetical protein